MTQHTLVPNATYLCRVQVLSHAAQGYLGCAPHFHLITQSHLPPCRGKIGDSLAIPLVTKADSVFSEREANSEN
jgi:hypothetical protein